jgi:hypothetical protein
MSFKEQLESAPVRKSSMEKLGDYLDGLEESERKIALAFIRRGALSASRAFAKEGYVVGEKTILVWRAKNGVQ